MKQFLAYFPTSFFPPSPTQAPSCRCPVPISGERNFRNGYWGEEERERERAKKKERERERARKREKERALEVFWGS